MKLKKKIDKIRLKSATSGQNTKFESSALLAIKIKNLTQGRHCPTSGQKQIRIKADLFIKFILSFEIVKSN